MEKKKVLIIDDFFNDFKSLWSHFSSEFNVLPDIKIEDGNNEDEDVKKDPVATEYFDAFNNRTALVEYVKKAIQENYRDLRLIVSDISFDGDLKRFFDGTDLIKYIRDLHIENAHDDYTKLIPIIATSKVSGTDYCRKAYDAKATLYIDKDVKDLSGKIISLTGIGKQLIAPFDAWCETIGVCRYKVGFSFTGENKSISEEHRAFVRDIAESLCRRCGITVFFDEFYDPIINSKNGVDLSDVYHYQCEKVVVFLSSDYNDPNSNVWTSDEWQLGIRPFIQETSFDNLCLLNLSSSLDKNTVLSRMFNEINNTPSTKANTQIWDLIYKDISKQRDLFYELVNSQRIANQCFDDYFSTFKKEKLKTIVDFIIKRFHLTEIMPN